MRFNILSDITTQYRLLKRKIYAIFAEILYHQNASTPRTFILIINININIRHDKITYRHSSHLDGY